jgi:hypothetical protein
MAWVPLDREEEAWPLGILKADWGISSNTWWMLLKTRVSKPSLNQTLQNQIKPTQNLKTQSIAMDCAFKEKLGRSWVIGFA